MANNTVDQSFVIKYQTEVKSAYQREGSLLMNTVRKQSNVVGKTARFQKWGKMTTSSKTRTGDLVADNPTHEYIDVTMEDRYSNYYVDKLDLLKTNNDERQLAAQNSAWALGRDSDGFIIDALSGTSNVVGDYSTGGTLDIFTQACEMLDDADVLDKGRFGLLRSHNFTELKNLAKVTSRDYVGDSQFPWLSGTSAFEWNGVLWMKHSGLNLDGTQADGYVYHMTAVGHASGLDVDTEINYIPEKRSYLISSAISQQAGLIDDIGVIKLKLKSNAALT